LLSSSLTRSQVPLYVQLATLMRRRIATGAWRPGQQLPTLNELVAAFGVSRVTVRQAVAILESEGLVWRRQGKGTFVAEGAGTSRRIDLQTAWSALTGINEGASIRLIELRDAVHPQLEPSEGTAAPAYQYMRRVHSHEGRPYVLADLYLDRRIYQQDPGRFQSNMLLPLLERTPGVRIARAWQTLVIGTADLEAAEYLEIPLNAPVAEIRRIVVDGSGTIIYLGEVVYRGDFVRLEIELKEQRGKRP